MQRKINWLLVLFSLVGGALGFVIGELALVRFSDQWPSILIVGLYFGILTFCIGLFCLIAEMISPRLNGTSWRQRYIGTSWKLLVPVTLVMLFIAGTAFEWIYELNVGRARTVKDIVLIIDNSGSMTENDPDNRRYEAAKELIDQMDSSKRVAIVMFNDQPQLIQPLTQVADQNVKTQVFSALDSLESTNGGTDIALALKAAMEHIQERSGMRGAMAILLSDGFSDVNTSSVLSDYQRQGIAINTIGLGLSRMGNSEGVVLLQTIASHTGGQYYDENDASNLSLVFRQIYDNIDERTLLTERIGMMKHSMYYMILRVLLLMGIGALLGLSLGLMFDHRFLAKGFTLGGGVSGLLAGGLLEVGLSGSPVQDVLIRLLACLVLAGILTLFSAVVPLADHHSRMGTDRRGPLLRRSGGQGYAEPTGELRSKGF